MSKHPLREDKTCLNCFHVVEKRFCPNCAQENVETRKTFHHLFIHFFEDLTHYENAFWKTIRNLIFKPASLTKEYISGKRMSYLAPVRLYIFISFVTFLYIAITASDAIKIDENDNRDLKKGLAIRDSASTAEKDSILWSDASGKNKITSDGFGFGSLKEIDSVQKFGKREDKLGDYEYWFARKVATVTEKNSREEIVEKFTDSFVRNLPKVLFIYMPLFALVLWIFQSKKRWYYFDHGIFTLHYFSFLLLVFLILAVFEDILLMIADNAVTNSISNILTFVGTVWMFYYFFPAHHRFYSESRLMSVVKGSMIFFINIFFIVLILLIFAIYTFINLH